MGVNNLKKTEKLGLWLRRKHSCGCGGVSVCTKQNKDNNCLTLFVTWNGPSFRQFMFAKELKGRGESYRASRGDTYDPLRRPCRKKIRVKLRHRNLPMQSRRMIPTYKNKRGRGKQTKQIRVWSRRKRDQSRHSFKHFSISSASKFIPSQLTRGRIPAS